MAAGDLYHATGGLRYRNGSNVEKALLAFTSTKVQGFTAPNAANYDAGTILLYQGQFDRGSGWEGGIILLIKVATTWTRHAFVGPLAADANFPNVAGTGVLYVTTANLCLQCGGQRYTGVE